MQARALRLSVQPTKLQSGFIASLASSDGARLVAKVDAMPANQVRFLVFSLSFSFLSSFSLFSLYLSIQPICLPSI